MNADRQNARRAGRGRDIAIRIADTSDNVLLAELGARTFFDTFAADNEPGDMAAYLAAAFGPDVQAAELAEPDTTFLVAEANGAVVGYARLRRGAAPSCIPGTDRIEIVRLYADRPWLGQGVGRALMGASLDIAVEERCETVWLDVWERNRRAIEFYERWGFEPVGSQDFVLGCDVQHDLLMARRVGGLVPSDERAHARGW
jgi:ribosomal protein S18 acetylase RimI-like enzyme